MGQTVQAGRRMRVSPRALTRARRVGHVLVHGPPATLKKPWLHTVTRKKCERPSRAGKRARHVRTHDDAELPPTLYVLVPAIQFVQVALPAAAENVPSGHTRGKWRDPRE
jgi:hypothetical protein